MNFEARGLNAAQPLVLAFAGLDPSGRAGLLADGESIRARGALPALCATAIAAQSSNRYLGSFCVSQAALDAQLFGALDLGEPSAGARRPAAVKVGMVGRREALRALLEHLDRGAENEPGILGDVEQVIVDPVLSSSRGGKLFEGEPQELFPLISRALLVTPNLDEAAALLRAAPIADEEGMERAARALCDRCGSAVLLKGGHLRGDPSDLLVMPDGTARWFRGERLEVPPRRGTGCRLASAIAAGLALGVPLAEAITEARALVARYLVRGIC